MLLGSQALTNDPYFNNVSLLLSARDGLIKDYSKNNLSITNNGVGVFSSQAKWGSRSFYFSGSSFFKINLPSGTFNTLTWSISGWFYFSNLSNYIGLFTYPDLIQCYASNAMVFVEYRINGAWTNNFSAYSLPLNTWVYLLLAVDNGSLRFYVNGNAIGNVSNVQVGVIGQPHDYMYIGANDVYPFGGTMNYYLNGYISELRVTKDIARPIQVPTQPFPNW